VRSLADTLLFSMAVAAALFAVGQLLFTRKTARNYFLAIGVFCLCYVLLYFWAIETEAIRAVQPLLYSNITITFLVAPAIYLSFHLIILDLERGERPYWPHFAALPLVAALIVLYDAVRAPLSGGPGTPIPGQLSDPPLYAISLASDLYMLAYMLAANVEALKRVREGDAKKAKRLRYFRGYLLLLLASSIVTLLAYVLAEEAFFAIGAALFGVVVIGYALYCSSATGRERALWFGEGGRKDDKLKRIDSDRVAARLTEAMEAGKAFKDPQLSLPSLAKAIGVSPQQLSQLINERMGVNFRSYVNARRIREVQADLVLCPGKTILDIALENGFNSKTAFNTEFARACGQSPSEYRKSRFADPSRFA
jgi:AraC-like DNA-binding protein